MLGYSKSLAYKLEPYEHQQQAINETVHALWTTGFHALFMDMGLGKTMTTIHTATILQARGALDSVVIICPKALMGTWESEIAKHATVPTRTFLWDAIKSTTQKWQREYSRFARSEKGLPFLIVNVEAFQTKNKRLETMLAKYVKGRSVLAALDESSYIKNPKAQRTKRLLSWAPRFAYRLILTGTEITASVLDLYAQFAYLSPKFWGQTYYQFRSRYAIMEDMRTAEGRRFQVVTGFRRVDEIIERTAPYVTRMRKEDCLDLPEKIYEELVVDLNPEQRRVYDELRDELVTKYEGEILTAAAKVQLFIRFRQITGGFLPSGTAIGEENPKTAAIKADSSEYAGKVIVWASFVREIEALSAALPESVAYYGAISDAERAAALESFKDPAGAKYLIANPAIGAYGLNLQHCRLHYYFSRPTQAAQSWQSEDRSHRIGQTEHVVYKDVVAKGTVDRRILKILRNRTDIREMFRAGTVDDVLKLV